MSEEEKKAIETLKEVASDDFDILGDDISPKMAQNILEEKKAIETLKEVASDDFDILGDDISPKMAQNILNVIDKQQKEIEELNFENHMLKKWNEQLDQECISKDKIREKIKKAKEINWHTPKLVIEYFEELLEEI